jgi:transposase-like protein
MQLKSQKSQGSVELQSIIRGKVDPGSVIYSDKWYGYNGLVDVGFDKHYRVDHGKDEFVNGRNHINGIEGFWGFSKTRRGRYRGIDKKYFYLYLKECEFGYNYRKKIYIKKSKDCKRKSSILIMTLIFL